VKFRRLGSTDEKIELQMTPMIDIVFQLLIFFIFTFRIAGQEGDFSINMPPEGVPSGTDVNQTPPIEVRIEADRNGAVRSILMNDRAPSSFRELQLNVIDIIGDDRGPGSRQETSEVILDCDYNLRYEHVIEAMSAVTGYVNDEGTIVKLAEKVRFAPQRDPPP
jgi:biopolymer transport protein ExbD